MGGIGPVGNQAVSHIQLFDTSSNKWRLLMSLPMNIRSPQIWINQQQSILYLQNCHSMKNCTTQEAHMIWAHNRKTEKCLFLSKVNCITRQLESTPYLQHRSIAELSWNMLFSQIYLINMPDAVERLRQTWYELKKMDLTSITLFQGFRLNDIKSAITLLSEH